MKTKGNKLVKLLCLVALIMAAGTGAQAQDLKSLLSGVVKSVVGDQTTTESSIVGTWAYSAPDCQFESDNLLAKAGGEVAATQVESKLKTVYKKLGMTNSQFTFSEDGSFSISIKGKSASGTYTFDSDAKTVSMKTSLGVSFTAYVTVTGSSMSLVFDASKLMTVLKSVAGAAASVNSTASTISSLAGSYSGLRLGFELTKQ